MSLPATLVIAPDSDAAKLLATIRQEAVENCASATSPASNRLYMSESLLEKLGEPIRPYDLYYVAVSKHYAALESYENAGGKVSHADFVAASEKAFDDMAALVTELLAA